MQAPEVAHFSLHQQVLFSAVALALVAVVVAFLRRGRLDLRHAIMWFPVGGALLFFSIFPSSLVVLSRLMGFQVASNAVISLAIVGLIFLLLLQSVALGRAKKDLRDLAQRMALWEARRDQQL